MPLTAHLDSCKDSISTPRIAEIILAGAIVDCTAKRRLEKKEIPKIPVKLLWNRYFF